MKQFSAYTFQCMDDVGFDPKEYSRLKFGSQIVADKFGKDLAIKFFNANRLVLETDDVVVIPSAYNIVEIAAYMLARSFMSHLNIILVKNNMRVVKWTTMHRTITYFSDYACMTSDERKAMLNGDTFYINKDFIKGKTLLFVDDCVITGTHEEKIEEFIKKESVDNKYMFVYYVKYVGNSPEIESALNTSGVNDADSYIALINEPGHKIIVRTCKFLLNGSRGTLLNVLGRCSDTFMTDLYIACTQEEYHSVPRYRENMKLIKFYYDIVTSGDISCAKR